MQHLFNSTGYPLYNADIVRGRGCYVYDINGKEYLDLEAGVWALPLGHCDPDITAAMHRQIDEILHVGYKYNQPIAETCAENLLRIAGMDEGKCVFLTSGSEAVEYGVQLAKTIRPGKKCICLGSQYLSAYGLCGQKAESSWDVIPWDFHDRKSPDEWYRQLKSDIDFSQAGVFVFEPGNTSGLVKLPPHELVSALSRLIREHSIVTVVDEVTCGIGRTGKWFGFQHYDLKPDIIAAGKGIGNGYPVSAVIIGEQTIAETETSGFHFAQSHQNDPMGCRVVYEVVAKIERINLLNSAEAAGEYFRKQYGALQRELPVICEIRGVGLLNCIELSDSVPEAALRQADQMLFDCGIIAGVKPRERVIRTYCPLIVTEDMIDRYMQNLKFVLERVI
ncbi:MAG: aminotransferase class III-fold pyridoxal phosphate-dependent enzyme [Clostridiaceae bacterium]|nr:aminotransferase class III-fold pyridoxal phosphate-dependent enzyme [Clostridiaceae bacterium]